MKLKDGFVMQDVMDKTFVVPTKEAGDSMRILIKLNGTGRFTCPKTA